MTGHDFGHTAVKRIGPAQRRRHGHRIALAVCVATNGKQPAASGAQTDKFAKELHRPISS
jgi:hypothetical protein